MLGLFSGQSHWELRHGHRVSDAKAQLTDLVHRAEAGEEIVLTRFGAPVARITPVRRRLTPSERGAVIERVQEEARGKISPGSCAARSADFLYDEDGLPG